MKTILLLTTALLITTGCNEEKKKEIKQEVKKEVKEETSVYTVQYYLDHKDLREQRIKECKALVKITPKQERDCRNAARADWKSRQNKIPRY